jgi:hypothetical protein
MVWEPEFNKSNNNPPGMCRRCSTLGKANSMGGADFSREEHTQGFSPHYLGIGAIVLPTALFFKLHRK